MKKIIIFFILLFLSYDIFSQQIKIHKAKELGIKFLKYKTWIRDIKNSSVEVKEVKENDTTFFYEVHVNNVGTVILSANYLAGPFLAYSNEGRFDFTDNLSGFNFWINLYKDVIRYTNTHSDSTYFQNEIIKKINLKSTQSGDFYLIHSHWGQKCYYNSQINDGGEGTNCYCQKCAAGCVAIAVAQIMRYWRFPVYFDWCNMPAALSMFSTPEEINATANLIADIGVVLNMHYCSGNDCGSWASIQNVKQELPNEYGYHSSIDIKRKFYYSQKKWEKMIREQLNAGQPVFYAGCTNEFFTDDLEVCGGHAFVCDGYNYSDNDYFHFNMGWNGVNDAFYYMFNDDGSSLLKYKRRQSAIINIKPSTTYNCNSGIVIKEQYQDLPFGLNHSMYFKPTYGTISTAFPPNNVIISSGEKVIYRAFDEIILNDGFVADLGSEFTAEIVTCPTNCILMASNNINNENEYLDEENNNVLKKDTIVFINEPKLSVYPNPFNDFVMVEWRNHSKASIIIYNVSGIEVLHEEFFDKISLDLRFLPKGLYIIRCFDNYEIESVKLIKD